MQAKKFFAFLIPAPKTSLILIASCSMRGRFLEAILQRTERKLAGPGRPGTVDGLVAGGALGGAAPCLGRARLPCRARWVHHPPQGCPLVPWRLPTLHRLAGSRGTGKPRTHCAARMRACGCLKFEFEFEAQSQLNLAPLAGRGRSRSAAQ